MTYQHNAKADGALKYLPMKVLFIRDEYLPCLGDMPDLEWVVSGVARRCNSPACGMWYALG